MNFNAAVVRTKGGPFKIECVGIEEPRDDEVLVRIAGVGVCHTDIVVRDQYFPTPLPAILGHEGAGVVEKVGARVTKVAVGDHVVLSFASCGVCANCQSGQYGYCPDLYGCNFSGGRRDGSSPCCDAHGQRLSGFFFSQSSFGEFALATERNVVKISKDVPLEIMGPLGCGIQTGAGAVINALKPGAGTSIAVGSTYYVGGTTKINGVSNYDQISTANIRVGFAYNFLPGWNIMALYGRDVAVRNGFSEENRVNLRLYKIF